MKKSKSFKVGDRVFGKVKGYPAWPAQVVGISGKKYNVRFYGTGETGCLKPEDLFYFLSNKPHLLKPLKRKDYNDAIAQIEAEIAESGTDGDGVSSPDEPKSENIEETSELNATVEMETNETKDETIETKDETIETKDETKDDLVEETIEEEPTKAVKRKRSISGQDATGKRSKGTPEETTESEKEETSELKESNEMDKSDSNIDEDIKPEETPKDVENDNLKDQKDLFLIPEVYLNALSVYAKKIEEKKETYKSRKPDLISLDDLEDTRVKYLPVKLPTKKYVALKLEVEDPLKFDSEYDRALSDRETALALLQIKKDLESGKQPEEKSVIELNLDESSIEQSANLSMINCKKRKVDWLKREAQMYHCMLGIKKSLGLEKAEPKEAVKHLEAMLACDSDPLILKKHPAMVDTMKRLQRYIGNVKSWQMSKDEVKDFKEDAQLIRELAEKVYEKFKQTFSYGNDDKKFIEHFKVDCDKFSELTKDLSEAQVISLHAEPESRMALMDEIYESLGSNFEDEGIKMED